MLYELQSVPAHDWCIGGHFQLSTLKQILFRGAAADVAGFKPQIRVTAKCMRFSPGPWDHTVKRHHGCAA